MSYIIDYDLQLSHLNMKLEGDHYCILTYNKGDKTVDMKTAMYRSVIVSKTDLSLLSFSHPRSISMSTFIEKRPAPLDETIWVNEIIEGQMVNLFYDREVENWEMATRFSVEGCFREKMIGALGKKLSDITFPKNYCYSFVLTATKQIYLISVYEIIKRGLSPFSDVVLNIAVFVPPSEYEKWGELEKSPIRFPRRFTENDYSDLRDKYCSIHSDSSMIGMMFTNLRNGERAKMMNSNYIRLKMTKEVKPNILYLCLCFQRMGQMMSLYMSYPQYIDILVLGVKAYRTFVDGIYQSYMDFYVKKRVASVCEPFRKWIADIHHGIYLPSLRNKKTLKKIITKSVVEEYVISCDPIVIYRGILGL